jgi:hypothetical protein
VNLAEVRARDGDRCARCGSPRNLHVHHRLLRSQGGPDVSENVITLCAMCHRWAHGHPYAAREEGLLLRSHEDPATIPVKHVLWPAGPVLLGPDLTFILSYLSRCH